MCSWLTPSLKENIVGMAFGEISKLRVRKIEVVNRKHGNGEGVWWTGQVGSETGSKESLAATLWTLNANK